MVQVAEARGDDYVAITDHSPALRITGGLDPEGFRAQASAIDRLNRHRRRLRVLKSVEVEIHDDGTLDLDDRTLAGFDLVTAAIHSARRGWVAASSVANCRSMGALLADRRRRVD